MNRTLQYLCSGAGIGAGIGLLIGLGAITCIPFAIPAAPAERLLNAVSLTASLGCPAAGFDWKILPAAMLVYGAVGTGLSLPVAMFKRPPAENACLHCGYDLTGNISGVCPECGQPSSPNTKPQ